jgi:3',5'-nucleoside bisphosphate phosphatase
LIKADLHLHTSYSDGKHTPAELFELASKKKIGILSVTDHDNFEGSVEMSKFDGKNGFRVIPGIELSAEFHGREIHILGYGINFNSSTLKKHLELIKKLRISRFEKILKKLSGLGVNLNSAELLNKFAVSCSIGRPHIAKQLVSKGFVKNYKAAFTKYIGDNKPAYVEKDNLNYKTIIEIIKKSGGTAYVAHPSTYFRESALLELKKAGIEGIEAVHPSHTENMTKKYSDLAEKHRFFICGGSDFHGYNEDDIDNLGKYCIDEKSILNLLK